MKIIHIPFCFYPDPIGGTEVYVEALATNLQRQGINSPIAAPGNINQSYQHGSLTVHRFALSSTLNLRDLYGLGDSKAAQNFNKILDQEKPDLVHLHAFTSGVSFRLVQAAKQRHIPVMFTYHTPTVSCQRGTLLYNGTEICEGKLDRFTCTSCTLQGMGINSRVSQGVANLGFPFTHWLETLNLQGGIWTALRMGELVQCRQQAFSQLMAEADRIIAVCNWVKELLLLNQIPENKITVLRQGLCHPSSSLSLPVKSPLMAPNEQPRSYSSCANDRSIRSACCTFSMARDRASRCFRSICGGCSGDRFAARWNSRIDPGRHQWYVSGTHFGSGLGKSN